MTQAAEPRYGDQSDAHGAMPATLSLIAELGAIIRHQALTG
jgi:hypothetical protein